MNTGYQNTGEHPREVIITVGGDMAVGATCYAILGASAVNSPPLITEALDEHLDQNRGTLTESRRWTLRALVPPGFYYGAETSLTTPTIWRWLERDLV